MKIEIFDVALGQCAIVTCPDSQKFLVDVGHKSGEWHPSKHCKGQRFGAAFIGNFDDDHTSDLVELLHTCYVDRIIVNPTVNAHVLAQLKAKNGMGQGIQWIHRWLLEMGGQINPALNTIPDFGEVSIRGFYKNYAPGDKSNDLSLAVFVQYRGFTILFPGDLEEKGWHCLLGNAEFRALFAKTHVLVASHHGRDNGRCLEMSQYCNPHLIIISDAGKQYTTQETGDWYAYRTQGLYTRDGRFRKVLTTRSNGKITLDVDLSGKCHVSTSRNDDVPTRLPAINYAIGGLPSLGQLQQNPVSGIRLADIARFGLGDCPQIPVRSSGPAAIVARDGLGRPQGGYSLPDALSRPNLLAKGLLDFAASSPRQAIPDPTAMFLASVLRKG